MESDPIDTEISEEVTQAEEDANAPPPETIIVKRGRPAGSKNKAKAESSALYTGGTVESAPQPDPMYTALMKRLDAMDGMLAQRQAEIAKKEKAPPRPRKARVERDISPEPAPKEEFRIQGITKDRIQTANGAPAPTTN